MILPFPGALLVTRNEHTEAITGLTMSPDGSKLATASKDGTVRFWSSSDGWACLGAAKVSGWAFTVSFSPDGCQVATAVYKGDGMAIIDTKTYTTISAAKGTLHPYYFGGCHNLCCRHHSSRFSSRHHHTHCSLFARPL